MKLFKLFLVAVIGLGFMACNADEQPVVENKTTDSYASITIKFPGKVSTRALPGDYNENGTWMGRDNLETVTVFLVNETKGVVDYNFFSKSAFAEIDINGVLHPNLALKATAGENVRAYVVINGVEDILNTLKATSAANFATAFAAEANKIASQVAWYNSPVAPATKGTETIMMTNDQDAYALTVLPYISEEDAKTGVNNNIRVNVERVVSRAFMTVVPEETEGNGWPVNALIGGTETQIATVKGVSYAVGQSNKKFYIMKRTDFAVPDPVYTFVPADFAAWAAANNTNFDYSGLTSFTTVTQWAYDAANVSTPLAAETTSKFVLPVNHVVNVTDLDIARGSYKKGNTTYFEIRAQFIPNEVIINSEGGVEVPTTATTVFWGENDKKFYKTRDLAIAQGQKATEFIDGVMKYVLWLNPNALASTPSDLNPKVSPTVRNQVYHAHIDKFLRMGLPNNPLNPDDPDKEGNPDNPINAEDPLKTDYTYLSVSVKVLPWTIHTYKYNLDDPGTMY